MDYMEYFNQYHSSHLNQERRIYKQYLQRKRKKAKNEFAILEAKRETAGREVKKYKKKKVKKIAKKILTVEKQEKTQIRKKGPILAAKKMPIHRLKVI